MLLASEWDIDGIEAHVKLREWYFTVEREIKEASLYHTWELGWFN